MKSQYLSHIEEAYQGEVYGEAMYNAIADKMDDPDHAHKWRVLAQMEKETKAHIRELVKRLGGDVIESETERQKGIQEADKYASMPWIELMKTFSEELDVDIEAYSKLEKDCPPEDAAALRRLTEHEVLTKEFCDMEVAGNSDESILGIIAFCETPPVKK